jgi:hypothetical protein
MSTTVTFAGNLAEDPELLYTHDQKPFVSCRVLVNRRIQNEGPTPSARLVAGSRWWRRVDRTGPSHLVGYMETIHNQVEGAMNRLDRTRCC